MQDPLADLHHTDVTLPRPLPGSPLLALAAAVVLVTGIVGCAITPAEQTKITTVATNAATDAKVAGQLFCAVHTAAGDVVVGLVNAGVGIAAPSAAPIAVIVTGATHAFANAACAQAGGIPVVPPVVAKGASVPQVAIDPPAAVPAAPPATA